MGLPSNFNSQTIQLGRRFNSLKDLKFYTVTYKVKSELSDEELIELGIIIDGNRAIKRFSSINIDESKRKVNEWLETIKESGYISEFNIIDIEERTLIQELDRQKLIDLFPVF